LEPDLQNLIIDIARSLGFLSRLPIPGRFFSGSDGSLTQSVRAFPIAGIMIAMPSAAIFATLLFFHRDAMLSAFIALSIQTLLTGALHEDGLADSADGLLSGRGRDKALEIMRDSRIGSYGAIALIVSYGTRASALGAIAHALPPAQAGFALLGVAAISRTTMIWHWITLPAARRDGVAASSGTPDETAGRIAYGFGLALFILIGLPACGLFSVATALAASGASLWIFTAFCRKQIGGHTGDTIGATQQLSEIATLVALALFA
jgi:adenosylcobinamide-GDP ribazoletransferase